MGLFTVTALAKALNRSKSYVSRLSRQPWFPQRGPDGWDVEAVRAAIAANRRTRRRGGGQAGEMTADASQTSAGQAPAAEPARVLMLAEDDPDLATLEAGHADPTVIARAAVRIVSKGVAQAIRRGTFDARQLDNLKRALEELRRSEDAYMELRRRKGELIERDIAVIVAAHLGHRLVAACTRIESALPSQCEIWRGVKYAGMNSEAFAREVGQWAESFTRELRGTTVDQVEQELAKAIEEYRGGPNDD